MRDPEILTNCLVEGDPARVGRSRRLRRKALLFSVGVEAMLLAALLLAPLATPSTLSRHLDWIPMPPFAGSPHVANVAPHPHGVQVPHHGTHSVTLFQPPTIPHNIPPSGDQPEENLDSTPSVGSGERGPGDPNGVPFGSDSPIGPRPPAPPKPSEHGQRIIHMSQIDTALLTVRVMPVYPPLAVQTRQEGEVKLHAIIATDGSIESLEVVSGGPLFIQAARDAVRQWRYKPALLTGQPVEVDTFITVIFHLER